MGDYEGPLTAPLLYVFGFAKADLLNLVTANQQNRMSSCVKVRLAMSEQIGMRAARKLDMPSMDVRELEEQGKRFTFVKVCSQGCAHLVVLQQAAPAPVPVHFMQSKRALATMSAELLNLFPALAHTSFDNCIPEIACSSMGSIGRASLVQCVLAAPGSQATETCASCAASHSATHKGSMSAAV